MTTPESLIREWEERADEIDSPHRQATAATLRHCAEQLREAVEAGEPDPFPEPCSTCGMAHLGSCLTDDDVSSPIRFSRPEHAA